MPHPTSKRVRRIFEGLDQKVDAVVLMNDVEPNLDAMFPYLTGTTSGLFESCLVIGWPDGKVELITVALEETSARSSSAEVKVFKNRADKAELVRDTLGKARTIGVNGHGITLSSMNEIKRILPKVEMVDIYPALERARAIKDTVEVERLRNACRIASAVAEEIPSFVRPGMA
jgi:Xaa-Pro dipeptidase